MLEKVKKAITRFSLTEGKKHITVALSGGADSMALLFVLLSLKEDLNLQKISAAHFNHKIRGTEAQRDEDFVKKICAQNGVQLFLGSADVPAYAKKNHLSTELAARQLRYDFFESIDTDAVATAHTASDNIETVILNMSRGTALSGLCGIPPERGRYIRPLLYCTRTDIENYCIDNNIDYVTDSTNLSDDYTRNKIRHNVVPVLKQFNGSVETAVLRMSDSLREDEDFINTCAVGEYNARFSDGAISIKNFSGLHPAVAKRIIARYYALFCGNADSFHINRIYSVCLSGGKTSVPDNQTAVVRDDVLKIVPAVQKQQKPTFDVKITEQKNNFFSNSKKVHNLLLKNILDCDKIVGKLVLRQRIAGDKIRLKNKNCTKTLKKLFCEYKIPLEERNVWPVLSDDSGVVWVHKIGVSERCAADISSKRIYKIYVEKIFIGEDKYE